MWNDICGYCEYMSIYIDFHHPWIDISPSHLSADQLGYMWIYVDICGLIYQNSPQCRPAWEHPHTVRCQRGKVFPAARRCTLPQAPCGRI